MLVKLSQFEILMKFLTLNSKNFCFLQDVRKVQYQEKLMKFREQENFDILFEKVLNDLWKKTVGSQNMYYDKVEA